MSASVPRQREGFQARDRHPQALFALGEGEPMPFGPTWLDRATAVGYARRRSLAGTPCDVFDVETGALIYSREMDCEAARAQRGLFS